MKREETNRRMELFLEGLQEHLGAEELHEYVEWSLRIDQAADRQTTVRKKTG